MAILRVVHPFPSAVNALLVLFLALVAGGPVERAALLALVMLGLQFSIGAANDWFDADLDARTKPSSKPIPTGAVSRETAATVAAVAAAAALAGGAAFGPVVLTMVAAMVGAGLAYDAVLKRSGWGWVAFAVAFPILPLYAWYGMTGELPPRWELLVPLAALAGPALQLANGLVDLESDTSAGVLTLAGRLGARRAVVAMTLLLALIHVAAWASLPSSAAPAVVGGLVVAAVLAAGGVPLSASAGAMLREWGFRAQVASVTVLGAAWVTAAAA